MNNFSFDSDLTPRGQIPLTPKLPPLPAQMTRIPFGLDENGKHIKDIRGNVIKPVIECMLARVEKRNPAQAQQARAAAQTQLIERLNARIPNSLYHISFDYLLKEGNLYSYEFSAFLHCICNELADDPHYFFNIGLHIIPDSIGFLLRAGTLTQVYATMARIGSKFSAEQFETLSPENNSVIIQRRTPVTRAQLGEAAWLTHVSSGCHTLRGALSTFPKIHSGRPYAEIEERKCLLRGDDCCEWKVIWQEKERRGWFGWLKK
jgi:hypothetical protein